MNFEIESFFKYIYIYFEKEGERRLRLILLEELLDSDGKEKREFNGKGIGCKYILIVGINRIIYAMIQIRFSDVSAF